MTYCHIPVLLNEVIDCLSPQSNESFIDATVGGGGHAAALLAATGPDGRLLGFDRDRQAVAVASQHLSVYGQRAVIVNDSYSNLAAQASFHGFTNLAGILFDLGFSSPQLNDASRGFSYQVKAQLDLRYDSTTGIPAWQWLQRSAVEEIAQALRSYGEVPRAGRLARAIVSARRLAPIVTTGDLLQVVDKVLGRGRRSLNPATLVWQALRITVNDELNQLVSALPQAVRLLKPGGRLAVISFHSGEDKIVKNFFQVEAKDCLCPPNLPVCRCRHQASLKIITARPITAAVGEINHNPRARSAKLRLAIKLDN
ncbi:MAG: 16S rRNA (cytosine(1402)-N(4))-methyltransferase RsmH [Patescibacteria group bacterium]